jgi:V/A-type H+-transporting ATPase subunit F
MSSKKGEFSGRIAAVGDRELVLGYSLLGVQDTFMADRENASKLLTNLMSQPEYSLIVVSSSVKKHIPASLREKLEASVSPLVVFTPEPYSGAQEEPLSELAKRVLGVDLKGGKS